MLDFDLGAIVRSRELLATGMWVTLRITLVAIACGLALGMTLPQAYRSVLLPVAYRTIIPPLTSEFLIISKNSAVASTIGLLELSGQARQLVDYTAQPYESFICVTLGYVVLNFLIIRLMGFVRNRTHVPGLLGQ